MEYGSLKCYNGSYHKQEWYLLGGNDLDADYSTITHKIYSSELIEGDIWPRLVYFTDIE